MLGRASVIMAFAVIAILMTTAIAPPQSYAQSSDEPVSIYIGVMTPSSAIEAAAINQSIKDVNDILVGSGAQWRLEAVYPDIGIGLAEFITTSNGVMAFVGPGDTASLLQAKEAIADTGYAVVYVGCCVPATHSGILNNNDNVFVLAPDVLDQATAIAVAMEAAGIEYAIPVYSGDLSSSNMRTSIAVQFDGVMDPGVLVSSHTLDYSPLITTISNKIESVNGKAVAILILEPDITAKLMTAGDTLSDVAWFGTSSEAGLPSLDGAAADFAEDVGYMIPKFGTVHEPRLMVNHLYTQEAWSAYEAVQIVANSLSNPTVDFVPFFGRWAPMPVEVPQSNVEALSAAIPLYAASYGGGTGSTAMDANGVLASPAYLLYGVADGTWIKEAVYNPSTTSIVGRATNGQVGDFVYVFEPTQRLHDVHTLGALLPLSGSLGGPAEQRLTAARVAVSVTNELNDGYGNDWYVDLLIEDTETNPTVTLEKLQQMDRLGIKMVVGPSASSGAAAVREYANENNIVLLSPSTSHALSIPNDSLYRVSPPSIHEVAVLTSMLKQDGIKHVVTIHREDLWGSTLVEGLSSAFDGTINAENGYSPELANEGALKYDVIAANVAQDVAALTAEHDESVVAVILIGFKESANILEEASHHSVLGSVQWYGSAGNSNRLAIPSNDVALAFAESVGFKGPILTLDDGIAAQIAAEYLLVLHAGEHLDPYSYVTYDAVYAAGLSVGLVEGHPASEVGPILSSVSAVNFIAWYGGLDENGDLAVADYDIWQIQDGKWHNILVYDADREKFLTEVIVGVPTPLSGIYANPQRTAVYWLAELAANGALVMQDADWRLVMVAQDTANDPQRTLQVVKSMHESGINLILGSPTTTSLEAISEYIEENDMLVLSCCSTATDLALPDRIFRLAPDDTREAEALNALFEEHAIEHLIISYRDDTFGTSLSRAITNTFDGTTVTIPYDSKMADYGLLDYGSLVADIADAAQPEGEPTVAVLLIGHGESADIMASASEHSILELIKWYGTSGIAKQSAIITNMASAAFAETVNYEATFFAEPPPDPFVVGGLASVHFVPDAYTYTTYDAVFLLSAAIEAAGSGDALSVAMTLPAVASQFSGTLGNLTLNANGDLEHYSYDVWHVRNGVWSVAATYHSDDGLEYSAP